jgi:hypothetical protein
LARRLPSCFVSAEGVGTISASSPSILRNSSEVAKPIARPAFFARRLLHEIKAGNAAITIGRAFPYSVGHSRIRFDDSAKNLFFRRTIPLTNNAPRARNTQRYSLFRRSSIDFDGDRDSSFFLRSAPALRVALICADKNLCPRKEQGFAQNRTVCARATTRTHR